MLRNLYIGLIAGHNTLLLLFPTVAQQLLKDGIYFIGFDMIAALITEINVTSPRLLLAPASDADPYQQIAAKIAALCH